MERSKLELPIIESTLQKVRRRSRPLIPTSIHTFDESENGQQAAIFISDVVASKLGRINKIFFDGTFKTSPAIFPQNFVVFGKYYGHAFPLCYALATGKSKLLYEKIFSKLKDEFGLNPEKVMSDWEGGSRAAARRVWPDSVLKGCFFHFTPVLQKKIRRMGLAHLITMPDSKRTIVRVLCLPLLPAEKIVTTFEQNQI